MQKEQRIAAYRESLDRARDERVAKVQEVNQRLESARQRLDELDRYRAEYARALPTRIAQGLGAAALLDYQSFMLRLTAAIDAQREVLRRTEQERDYGVARLREVAVQHHAVSAVISRWRDEERIAEQRRDQRASDERAQQSYPKIIFQEAS